MMKAYFHLQEAISTFTREEMIDEWKSKCEGNKDWFLIDDAKAGQEQPDDMVFVIYIPAMLEKFKGWQRTSESLEKLNNFLDGKSTSID